MRKIIVLSFITLDGVMQACPAIEKILQFPKNHDSTMCKKIDENVTRMGELMMELRRFTAEQLIDVLRREDRLLFPLFWNVHRYLRHFEELGALRSQNDVFEVVK